MPSVAYCTTWVTDAVLLAIFESPAYVTVTMAVPAGSDDVVSIALPRLSELYPARFFPW